jgi:hypothetical protein
MAIFKSPIASEIRGSVGGTTYARNKAGLYMRNRSKPVNPNTENQSRVRSQFQTQANGFSNLNVTQVLAWNQFAQGYPAVNKVGDTYTPSGKQMYIMCNQNLASIGLPPIDIPPYDTPVTPNLDLSAAAVAVKYGGPGPGRVTVFTVDGVASSNADAIVIVQSTPNMQAARQSYRNRMRQLGFDTQGVTQDLAIPFDSYFGEPIVTEGQIVNFRVAAVDPVSGVSSAWAYMQAVIETE